MHFLSQNLFFFLFTLLQSARDRGHLLKYESLNAVAGNISVSTSITHTQTLSLPESRKPPSSKMKIVLLHRFSVEFGKKHKKLSFSKFNR